MNWDWKALAAQVVGDHNKIGGSSAFVFSGLSVAWRPRLEVVPDEKKFQSFRGKKLTRKQVRTFVWEQKLGRDPSEVSPTTCIYSVYDAEAGCSVVGLGEVQRVAKEVA